MPATARGTIWWDFDGTLVSRPFMWTEAALRLLDRHSPGHEISAGALNEALESGMPWHRADHAHPDLKAPDLWWNAVYERYWRIFDEMSPRARVGFDAIAAIRDDILDASRYHVFEDVVPALTCAKETGWRNIVVSNHVPELADLVADLGLKPFFQTIVTSGVVGYEKPHRRLFEEAIRHSSPGESVWMIGDNVDADCRAACALGFRAILVRQSATPAFEFEAPDLVVALDMIERATSS